MKESKKCYKCGIIKPLNEFHKNKTKKDGVADYCRICNAQECMIYNRSKEGVVSKTYSAQKRACELRNHPMPTYTKNDLRNWLFSQELFHKLFDDWTKSDYEKDIKPSVDRKDDYKSYTLNNIQLMTWEENYKKSYRDRRNGINNKVSKTVLQYDLEGNFIKEYYSTKQAERELGICHSHISSVCKNKIHRNTTGGFIWKYKN